jgi:N-acetylglutamate synthase-like GNAT family acetyltransferase
MRRSFLSEKICAIKQFLNSHPVKLRSFIIYTRLSGGLATGLLPTQKKILNHSTQIFAFIEETDENLIAFCRVLSDQCYFAYIYDVIVKPGLRGKGLGRELIDTVLQHSEIKKLSSVELVCRKGMAPFYKKIGFSVDYGESVAMRLKLQHQMF